MLEPPPHTHSVPHALRPPPEELWRHLQQLGVERMDQQHPDFGRPDDALKHLIATR